MVDWIGRLADITNEWLKGVDFGPLSDAFANLSEALRNLFGSAEDEGADFYKNIILPIAQWTIEEALPKMLNGIAKVIQWFADHPEAAQTLLAIGASIAIVVTKIILIISFVKKVSKVIGAVKTIVTLLGSTTSLIIAGIIVAVVAVIAVIILVLTHLDDIKAWWKKLPTVVKAPLGIVVGIITGIVATVKNLFLNVIEYVKNNWNAAIKTFKEITKGLSDFIKKFSKGDFKGAMKALVNVVISLLNGMIDSAGNALNAIWGIIKSFINGIGSAVKAVGKVIGKDWGFKVTSSIDLSKHHISKLAEGGVVTKPTNAIVGEGRYNEAVIPLGNSPQLNEMLDKFAAKVTERPINTTVYIGDKKWNTFTQKSARLGQRSLGNAVIGGGYYG